MVSDGLDLQFELLGQILPVKLLYLLLHIIIFYFDLLDLRAAVFDDPAFFNRVLSLDRANLLLDLSSLAREHTLRFKHLLLQTHYQFVFLRDDLLVILRNQLERAALLSMQLQLQLRSRVLDELVKLVFNLAKTMLVFPSYLLKNRH